MGRGNSRKGGGGGETPLHRPQVPPDDRIISVAYSEERRILCAVDPPPVLSGHAASLTPY